MHFNPLRLHIFFCNGRNINPSVPDKENNLSVMAEKYLGLQYIVGNMAVNSFFKQNDEQPERQV